MQMITNEDVLKAIVECADENGDSDYYAVAKKLSIDMKTLDKIITALKPSHVANFELAKIKITDVTISIYNELMSE